MGRTNNNFKKVIFEASFPTACKLQALNEVSKMFPSLEFTQLFQTKECDPQDQYFFYELKTKKPFPIPSAN